MSAWSMSGETAFSRSGGVWVGSRQWTRQIVFFNEHVLPMAEAVYAAVHVSRGQRSRNRGRISLSVRCLALSRANVSVIRPSPCADDVSVPPSSPDGIAG